MDPCQKGWREICAPCGLHVSPLWRECSKFCPALQLHEMALVNLPAITMHSYWCTAPELCPSQDEQRYVSASMYTYMACTPVSDTHVHLK